MNDLKELDAIYTNQKSFYKKAYVKTIEYTLDNGCNSNNITYYELYSYNTLVCTIVHSKDKSYYKLNRYSFYSKTTIIHLKEFLKQYLIYNDVKRILIEKNYNIHVIQKYNLQ